MNSLKTIDNRRLVPRWQSLNTAYKSGEMLLCFKENDVTVSLDKQVEEAKKAWDEEKTLFSAIEYLEKQRIAALDYDTEAFRFVNKIINENDNLPIAIVNFFRDDIEISDIFDDAKIAVGVIRKQTILFPNDAYLWLELARNYLILGLTEKCEKALSISRTLAPQDRLVARSMMRYYHHTGNIDKALFYVRRMDNLGKDPLLLSGEIALSNTSGRTSMNIRHAKQMIESQKYTPLSLSELTSEIATMEIMCGRERHGKQLLKRAVDIPTENSFAQATWINQKVIKLPWIGDVDGDNLYNNYEGNIYLSLGTQGDCIDWLYVYEQCKLWNQYQPFSCAPVYLGGTIAADFLENYDEAYNISLKGLRCNKDDAGVLNNITYSAILKNNLVEAENYLKLQQQKGQSDNDKVVLWATKGLFEYRFGDKARGKQFYKDSYTLAQRINTKLYAKVLAYFYRELDRDNDIVEMEFVKKEILGCKDISGDFMLIHLLKKFNIV